MAVDVELALGKLGLEVRSKGRRYWTEDCPLPTHGKPNPAHRWANFFVRSEGARIGQYFCFSCKAGGRLVELVAVLRDCDISDAAAWLRDVGDAPPLPYVSIRFEATGPRGQPFRLPRDVEQVAFDKWPEMPRAYVARRGITADQVSRWRVGFAYGGRLEHRIVFPTWDAAGRLANYAARTFVDAEVRYLSADERERPDLAALWGEHLWPEPYARRVLVVCEGAINGLAIERALRNSHENVIDKPQDDGMPSLAGLSGSPSMDGRLDHRKIAKFATFRRLVVATDPDAAGDECADNIELALRRRPVEIARMRLPAGTDAADADPAELARALNAAIYTRR